MESRLIAKIAVFSTVVVMTFGLLSMVFAMEMGMHRCPVMSASSSCPSPEMGLGLFNHHVQGFQSLTFSILASALTAFLVIFLFFRLRPPLSEAPPPKGRRHRFVGAGPPSPLASLLFWSALHNKTGHLALVRVHAPRA